MQRLSFRHLVFLVTLPILVAWTSHSQAQTRTLVVQGQACHGANNFNGQPLTNYANAASFLPPDVFSFWTTFAPLEIGIQGASGAADLDATTPLNSIVVTHLSASFRQFLLNNGVAPAVLDAIPQEYFNVPIHEAFTIVDFAGTLGQLPPVGGVHKFVTGRNREEPVTLAEWNSATGTVELQCRADGTGRVRIEARDLLPHYAYTAWQVFAVTNNPLPFPFSTPIAPASLGGVPAIIVADAQGNATFERNLSYCPLDRENPLMYIALYVHWDHRLYGAVPEQSFLGLPTGLVGADHLCFPTGNHLLEAQP